MPASPAGISGNVKLAGSNLNLMDLYPSRVKTMILNWYLLLPTLVLGIIRMGLAQCQENVAEWASRSWCEWPDTPVKQHYNVTLSVHCHKSLCVLVWPYMLLGRKQQTHIPTRFFPQPWRTTSYLIGPLVNSSGAAIVTVLRPVLFLKFVSRNYTVTETTHSYILLCSVCPSPGALTGRYLLWAGSDNPLNPLTTKVFNRQLILQYFSLPSIRKDV